MTDSAPPASEPARSDARLFGAGVVALHTFLFSPLVGGVLGAMNHARLGNAARARQTLALCVGAVVFMSVAAWLWPASWGNAISGGISGGTAALAYGFYKEHKPLVAAHVAAGGRHAAFWPATLAGVALVGAVIGAALLAVTTGPFVEGVEAFEARDLPRAEAAFREALADDPDDDEARFNLALTLAQQGEVREARRLLGRVRDSSPIYPRAHALREELAASGE